jgi:hypothetical protein
MSTERLLFISIVLLYLWGGYYAEFLIPGCRFLLRGEEAAVRNMCGIPM